MHLCAHGAARAGRGAADMGQQEHIVEAAVARVDLGLALEHVEARRRELAGGEGRDQRVIIHDVAARRVHHDGALGQQRQRLGIDDAARLRRRGAVDGEEIAMGQHVLEAGMIAGAMRRLRRHGPARMIVELHAEGPWRAWPPPGRCGPCRGCRAACPKRHAPWARPASFRPSGSPAPCGRPRRRRGRPRGSAAGRCPPSHRSARPACW